jgi:hypothetical protein
MAKIANPGEDEQFAPPDHGARAEGTSRHCGHADILRELINAATELWG